MRVLTDTILQLLELGIQAFSKKRKVRKVLAELHAAGGHYDHFIAARAKIDAAEAAGVGGSLTADEMAALDFVMDRFAKTAKKLRRKMKKKK
jgi:hypothetical protein